MSLTPVSVLLAIACVACSSRPALSQASPVGELLWLAGCWERNVDAVVIEEQWLRPRGGTLLGVSRTIRDELLVGFEFMRIHSRGDTLVFSAQPSGEESTDFKTLTVGNREVAFENLDHDFPQRIRYRAVGRDSLYASIEGMRDGAMRRVDFSYARASCASGG
jgi:hypothetical protein